MLASRSAHYHPDSWINRANSFGQASLAFLAELKWSAHEQNLDVAHNTVKETSVRKFFSQIAVVWQICKSIYQVLLGFKASFLFLLPYIFGKEEIFTLFWQNEYSPIP